MTTDKILLDHGSGGKISHSLTKDMMLPVFDNDILAALNDGAIFELEGKRALHFQPIHTPLIPFFSRAEISETSRSTARLMILPCAGPPHFI